MPDPRFLNLLNGRLDVETGTLTAHSPRHRTTVQLPVEWVEGADCPAFAKFCGEVFPADAVAQGVPWEVVALCVLPLRGIDKAVLLLGDGSNGKSVFLEAMLSLVGDDNTSSVSLQAIGKNPFATADLRGKLLNVSHGPAQPAARRFAATSRRSSAASNR